ncbi:MAG: signal peptidase I [Bacilli bacterium]|nr:signal peptidase I [Bacilli bacterium]
MKKGYKKLITFELIICLIFILNSFVSNILSRYTFILSLIGTFIIFKNLFGIEKDKHRYVKDIILDTVIFLIIFLMLYYLFGIIIGFAKTGNHYTIKGMTTFIIPIIITVITKELLRYNVLCKAEGNIPALITSTLLFIIMDISSAIYYGKFSSNYEIFLFLALTVLPALSTNISFTYITKKVGYKPVIIYLLVTKLYYYLLPIVPNANEYITSVVEFTIPILYCYRVYTFFKKEHDEEVERTYKKRHIKTLIPSIIVVAILVYFTSGYFHYWAIAVASGSMSPNINKGDVVIIEKLDGNFDNLKIGTTVAFKYESIVVVHRLINIENEDGKYYFYTKGDANVKEDNFAITEDMMIGIVNHKIPFIGKPTVWLNEL